MPRSMTGYGRGECTNNSRKFIVELKSVNHRYNDINIRMPRVFNAFEDKLKKLLLKELSRGKTDVYVTFETTSADDVKIKLNEPLADAYYEALHQMQHRYGLSGDISIELLSKFPDLFSIERTTDDEKILNETWETLEQAALLALSAFAAMRDSEGCALREDILGKLSLISGLADTIGARAPELPVLYAERLKIRMSELLENYSLDETRLLTEITLFADKTCVDEELTRLYSHIRQMESILNENDVIGRKLDFLVQEMNREVNTIGSKSGDLDIAKIVVELKNEIEKIREQVQNIE